VYKAGTNVSEGKSASTFTEVRQETKHVSEIEYNTSVTQGVYTGCLFE